VVAGSADSYCPRGALTALATAMPTATVTVIDGADHFFFTGLGALDTAVAAWAARLGGEPTSGAAASGSPYRPTG
jgi:pimeloyl-ACP methyl ester carboxylesterase